MVYMSEPEHSRFDAPFVWLMTSWLLTDIRWSER